MITTSVETLRQLLMDNGYELLIDGRFDLKKMPEHERFTFLHMNNKGSFESVTCSTANFTPEEIKLFKKECNYFPWSGLHSIVVVRAFEDHVRDSFPQLLKSFSEKLGIKYEESKNA